MVSALCLWLAEVFLLLCCLLSSVCNRPSVIIFLPGLFGFMPFVRLLLCNVRWMFFPHRGAKKLFLRV